MSSLTAATWSIRGTPENVQRIAQSFLFTQLSGVSVVCHWVCVRQFTLCGTSSVSPLSGVCSFRVVGVQWGPLSLYNCTKGSPLWRSNVKQLWRNLSILVRPLAHKVQRDSFNNLVFHFIGASYGSSSPVPSLSSSLVAISFNQDQVTCLVKWH